MSEDIYSKYPTYAGMPVQELPPEKLRVTVQKDTLKCESTAELSPLDGIIGQQRALEALRLGVEMKGKGFNIFAAGLPGTGKHTITKRYLESVATARPTPPDWCYVYNFRNSYEPTALQFPAGKARDFQRDVRKFIEDAKRAIPAALQSEDFLTQMDALARRAEQERNTILSALNKEVAGYNYAIQVTRTGFTLIPLYQGKPIDPEGFAKLPQKTQMEYQGNREKIRVEIEKVGKQIADIESRMREAQRKLRDDAVQYAAGRLFDSLMTTYGEVPKVKQYLNELREDILENAGLFAGDETGEKPPEASSLSPEERKFLFRKYEANVIVDNSGLQGAPILAEDNPTFSNLFGKMEYETHFGTLVTDLTLIKGGSMHRANGGFLVLRVNELAKNPSSYDGLKRILQSGEIGIEEPGERRDSNPVKSLTPEPIPIDLKVILIGDPSIYQTLYTGDPDFAPLFKVKAHFDDVIERNDENTVIYGKFCSSLCKDEGLKHMEASGLAKIVEYGSRLAEDQAKLSTRFSELADVIREANYYAAQDASERVKDIHVMKALEEKIHRSNLDDEKLKEAVARGIFLIDTTGSKVGQINGLAVLNPGDYEFGQAQRVTASVGLGREGVINVEREAKLSGPTHTKGVLILSGYLEEKYAQDKPLSLSCRVVFEQSYGGVDGDSASSTELYAILSELSGIPIKQNFAVTGSVNQKGQVQAIGGVNEKIEGFYATCKAKGLKGDESVMIPASNVQHLMLSEEVVEAVRKGSFHIYAVSTIDEGIELLTGVKAGERQPDGSFELDTVHYKVNRRLSEMAEAVTRFTEPFRSPAHSSAQD